MVGNNSSDPLLSEFCCHNYDRFNSFTFTTTGNTAYLKFTSDVTNEFRGFKIEIRSHGTTTTTTSTTSTTNPITIGIQNM